MDTSSFSPFDTQRLDREFASFFISCPHFDSPIIMQRALHAIDTGGATRMVGSDDPAALERVLPVLKDTRSSRVFPVEERKKNLGAGHTMKTLNNYVSVGSIIALRSVMLVSGKRFMPGSSSYPVRYINAFAVRRRLIDDVGQVAGYRARNWDWTPLPFPHQAMIDVMNVGAGGGGQLLDSQLHKDAEVLR